MSATANAIEARYGLTPMQQGMLFHALYDQASQAYFIQIRARLEGPLDEVSFVAAWQRLGQRHGVLRTAFAWQRADAAQQVVWQRATVPVDVLQAPQGSSQDCEAWLADLAQKDRLRGFDLSRAPLMRVTLVRLGSDRHALVWSLHHLLVDGWSMASLLDELLQDYAAQRSGQRVSFAQRPAFEHYVRWTHRQSEGRAQAFWSEQLGGMEETTAIAAGRTAGRLPQMEEELLVLSPAQTDALIRQAERHSVTLSNLMLAMWMLCLSRWVGQADVVCGVTVSGRPEELPGAQDMVGLLINTLPLRLQVDESDRLHHWLTRVQARTAALQQHAHVGLVEIQQWSGLGAGAALFDHLFVFENYPLGQDGDGVAGLRVTDVQSSEPTDYPLTVVIVPGTELRIQFSLDTHRLRPTWARDMLGQYRQVLLQASCADPQAPLYSLPLLDEPGQIHLLQRLNDTRLEEPMPLVHEAFAASALAAPSAPAAVVGDRQVSYAELHAAAMQLSDALVQQGVGPDVPVAILLPRGLAMLTAVIALSHSGGVCVPLDPDYPDDRLRAIVDDACPALLLTVPSMAPHRSDLWSARRNLAILQLDESGRAPPATSEQVSNGPAVPRRRRDLLVDHLFYIVYTSGSTGRPKGIGLPHRAMANLVDWHRRTLPGAPRMLQFASIGFDASFHEMFAAWASGGCVVMIDEHQRRDFSALLKRVHQQRVDRVVLPVVVLQRWAVDHADEPELFEHLRFIITTGEQLQITQAVQSLFERLPHCQLHNHYGPAETHVVTAFSLAGEPASWPAYPPVGMPLQNTTAYVLDDWLQPTPVGVTGELYLGGDHLARGYWGRPDLTAERFVPHPWPQSPGQRLYRTGDQARWNGRDHLEFLGRRDLMVKIRGFRVELGEIESVIGEHPAVANCAVQLREDRPGDRVLVAYCVGRADGPLPLRDLRAHLAARLPDYMLPATWVQMPALPLNTNGKIHRRALPAPQADDRISAGRLAAPADALEELLASIWADVLGRARVLRQDDFFALGGHSLRAVQVMARLRTALKLQMPLRVLFENARLADFTQAVRLLLLQTPTASAHPAGTGESRIDILPRVPKERFELSHAQERFYILDQLSPGSAINQVAGSVDIQGPLSEPALHEAWAALVRRHEPLRTRIVLDQDRPQQILDEQGPTITPMPNAQRNGHGILDTIRDLCAQPIPILDTPLVRAWLLRRTPDSHSLVLSAHHAVVDGESIPVLVRDLASLYAASAQAGSDSGRPADTPASRVDADQALLARAGLAPLTYQLIDLAAHERTQGAAPWSADREFWATHLRDLPTLALPLDHPRPPQQAHKGGTVTLELDAHLRERAGQLARRLGLTDAMLHLGVLAHWLCRLTGQDEVAIGMPVSLRHRQPQADLIGLFLNTVVLRLKAGLNENTGAWLQSVRQTLLQAHAHAQAPFDRVVQTIDPTRDRSRSPLFQVLFDHHGWEEDAVRAGGLIWSTSPVEDERAKFDLTLTVEATRAGAITLLLEFDRSLIEETTARRWLQTHRAVLESMLQAFSAERPGHMKDLSLIGTQDARELERWQRGPQVPAAASSIVGALLCLGQDGSTRPALIDRAGPLGRGAFVDQVLRQAQALRQRGVGPETLVALNLPRSRELVIALCAVLIAGGAYLPLDPEHPVARRAALLERSGARLVLGWGPAEPQLSVGSAWLDLHAGLQELDSWSCDTPTLTAAADPSRGSGPQSLPDPRQLAYVLFTSGSTGEPKGVQIEHAALASYLDFAKRCYAPQSQALDMALFTAATFDLTVTTFFLPLLTGGTLHIVDPTLSPPAQLDHALRVSQAIKLTPSHLSMLALRPTPAPELQVAIVGGEALTPEQIQALRRCAPQVRVVNEYGPTEATVGCVVATVTGQEARTPIGRPIDRFDLRVVDEALQAVPACWEGELLLQGPGLARGYLGRPDLTAERFLPDPQAREPGARVYRTGDRVRWREDGCLDYFGRRDHQVKIRGHRIEPAEVEAALAAQEGVTRAVVLARDVTGSLQLVAYVQADVRWSEASASQQLRARLPAGLVPSHWVRVSHWPLTRHGKLDVQALPPPPASAEAPPALPPPVNGDPDSLQQRLLGVFRRALGQAEAGVQDNFFTLGGDSISALQFAAAAQREGLTLAPDALFNHQTVAALCNHLQQSKGTDASALDPLTVIEPHGPLEPTPIQEAFLNQEQLRPSHHAQAFVLELSPELTPDMVRCALEAWFIDHPALRMSAKREQGAWSLSVAERKEPAMAARPLQVIDGRGWTEHEQLAARRVVATRLQADTDLRCGQMLEAALLLGPEAHHLVVSCHHLAVDGVSWRILLEQLEGALSALLHGHQPEPRPERCSLRQWTDALPRTVLQPAILNQLPYWQAMMAMARTAGAISPDGGPCGEEVFADRELDAPQTRAWLLDPAARWHIGPEVLLLGALAHVIAPEDGLVHVDVEGHGRLGWGDGLDLSQTVGWFTAVYPLVWRDAQPHEIHHSVAVTAQVWRELPRQGVAFSALRQAHPDTRIRESLSGPNAPVLFNYHGQVEARGRPGALIRSFDEAPGPARDPAYRRPHPLEVMAAVVDGRLRLSVTHHPSQHREEAVQQLLSDWCAALERFEPHSHQPAPDPMRRTVTGVSLSADELDDLERTLLG